MKKRFYLLLLAPAVLYVCVVAAQQFPMLDMVADKVVQKYQNATCEQLWQSRGKQAGPEQERLVRLLREDAQMRAEFFNRISSTVMSKMFECGMIP
jgi:hypothetical protein